MAPAAIPFLTPNLLSPQVSSSKFIFWLRPFKSSIADILRAITF
jgi:hypothetical protein|tara:strand:+ start:16631 stop:16762 length:132 start_codon:yes stop_codon:yes gene_type:complete